eukprot:4914152-Alexandrium_andersonii.AAC.1
MIAADAPFVAGTQSLHRHCVSLRRRARTKQCTVLCAAHVLFAQASAVACGCGCSVRRVASAPIVSCH